MVPFYYLLYHLLMPYFQLYFVFTDLMNFSRITFVVTLFIACFRTENKCII